jgi:hypothetical protein
MLQKPIALFIFQSTELKLSDKFRKKSSAIFYESIIDKKVLPLAGILVRFFVQKYQFWSLKDDKVTILLFQFSCNFLIGERIRTVIWKLFN